MQVASMLDNLMKSKTGSITNKFAPSCRFCGANTCNSLGEVADGDMFGGRVVGKPISGGQLWHCLDCNSMFRYPALSEKEYLALYESIDSEIWEDVCLRKDQVLVLSELHNVIEAGRILDVGCYAGQLLAALPNAYEKFGVEPSKAAAAKASDKGIHVLGPSINQVAPNIKFDCIVSMDVIEHLLDPVDFFNKAFQLLSPKGFLIITTGNPNSFAWQHIFKSRFWYVTNAEHVSFPSQKFITRKAQELGGGVIKIVNFRYADIGVRRSIVKLFGQCVYALSPKLYTAMRGVGKDGSCSPSIYSFGLFKDHHLMILKKVH